jgi:putative membrane protein
LVVFFDSLITSMAQDGKISDHLANERTFLAWIRTSLGLMGFGFVVVKFSIFLRQIGVMLKNLDPVTSPGYSSILGIGLVAFGALIGILSFFRYRRIERQISNPDYHPSGILINLLAASILLIGICLVFYLIQST